MSINYILTVYKVEIIAFGRRKKPWRRYKHEEAINQDVKISYGKDGDYIKRFECECRSKFVS